LKGEIKKKNKIHERIQKKSKEKESYLKNNKKKIIIMDPMMKLRSLIKRPSTKIKNKK
jgi:hypothetical protein